ncbi:Armadillo-like helical domain containing protein 1 [Durusdinium trenchii]|uniref:Armadillo-like helical domain containing protein 1 n=1 Tax=Durusdinium trenchii TaxID=1381693 RepID=A0ABP0S1N5_9DINO
MEELFSKEAHLFLVRLTSWFTVTLPVLYELPLQLKVFLVFLEFREASIVRNFFESGTVVSLMRILATDCDVTEEVRCLSVLVLHRLVRHGRTHKEVLCSKGLISYLVECIVDGLKWETVKSAGSLLCELFRSNPNYQPPLAQRVSIGSLAQLVDDDYAGADWPQQLIPGLLILLEGLAPRVEGGPKGSLLSATRASWNLVDTVKIDQPRTLEGADAYCLLRRLIQRFRCDTMLWDYARQWNEPQEIRSTLRSDDVGEVMRGQMVYCACLPLEEGMDVDAWAEVEVAASRDADGVSVETCAKRLRLQTDAQLARLSGPSADYGTSRHAEAVNVLKLGLVMFLVKRSQDFCTELVNSGLTEMLLMCLLDVSRPMRQAAVLTELHHLQLLSAQAKSIVESVLGKRELLRALTAEQLRASGSREDFARARRRLRALQRQKGSAFTGVVHSADEHELQQRVIDQQMATLGIEAPTSTTAFLTEPTEEVEEDEAEVPRSGRGCYPVSRVPVGSISRGLVSRDTDEGALERGYELEHDVHDVIQEPTVLTVRPNTSGLKFGLTLRERRERERTM